MRRYLAIRTILFLAVFLIFHNLYKWSPKLLPRILNGGQEVFIAHAKIGVWSATVLGIGEYLNRQARGRWSEAENPRDFVLAQGLTITLLDR